jgi:hypothetical protein
MHSWNSWLEITKFGINLKHIDQQQEDTEDTASYS